MKLTTGKMPRGPDERPKRNLQASTSRIQVALIEDFEPLRTELCGLINESPGLSCVAACANAREGLLRIPPLQPDIVVVDIHLPDLSGADCVKPLKSLLPNAQILMFTVDETSRNIFHCLVAGATGYLAKTAPLPQLLEAIRELHAGGSPMSNSIARQVVEAFQQMGQSSMEAGNLTPRERAILGLLAGGSRYKEIAAALHISPRTVNGHLQKIYNKLHVRRKAEAVAKYLSGKDSSS